MVLACLLSFLAICAEAHDCEVDGIFYNLNKSDKTATVTYFGDDNSSAKYQGDIRIPETISLDGVTYTVNAIGSYAFNNCKDITRIHIPVTVTAIGKQAFYGCTGIKEVSVTDIEKYPYIKFEDEYSNPDRFTNGEIVEIVKTDVKFSAPVITKEPVVQDTPAPKPKEDMGEVYFNGTKFGLFYYFDDADPAVQQYAARLLFGEDFASLDDAVAGMKKLWKKSSVESRDAGFISMFLSQTYRFGDASDNGFASYRVRATLKGKANIVGLPQTADGRKLKAQYFRLSNGIDRTFIYDMGKKQVLGMDDIFQPAVAQKLKSMFGTEANLYAEDRCLRIKAKAGEGFFIFSPTTEKNFSDHFKQLVGWGNFNYDTPEYVGGKSSLYWYLTDSKIARIEADEAFDPVDVTLTVHEDGHISDIKVSGATVYCTEEQLLEICSKMPKWKPAYENGKPITKEAHFVVKAPRWIGEPEVPAEFPNGGTTALMKFIGDNLKYPKTAEEAGIQGRVICQFIVEEDGSISSIKIVKSVHPLLDAEALRVVSAMPSWKPGMHKGQKVRVKLNMPITFRLH